jgi:hypothetical protein
MFSFRYRGVTVFPQNGGVDCEDELIQDRPCSRTPSKGPTTFRPPVIPINKNPGQIPQFVSPATKPRLDQAFCSGRQDGAYEKPRCRCCNDFIMCFQRSPLVKYCPPAEVFSAQWSKCVSAFAAGCQQQGGQQRQQQQQQQPQQQQQFGY